MGLKVIIDTTKPHADGRCDIKLYIYCGGVKRTRSITELLDLNIDLAVLPSQFDDTRTPSQVRTIGRHFHSNAEKINAYIIHAYDTTERLMLDNPQANADQVLALFKTGNMGLLQYIEHIIQLCKEKKLLDKRKGTPIKPNTWKGYGNLLSRLKLFCDHKYPVSFGQVTNEFYNDYLHFLRFEVGKHNDTGKCLAENSIGTDIKNLKALMERAVTAGLTKNKAYESFYVIEEEADTIALNEEEVEAIAGLNLKKHQHLVEERDRFLVAYNFLQRFGDSISLDKGDFLQKNGKHFYKGRTTKTGERVMVPVMSRTVEILQRHHFKMPTIHNQESNWKLKELAKLAGITEVVTYYEHREGRAIKMSAPKYQRVNTHTCRRSGATNMYLVGIPVKIIMDLGGWRTEEEFFKYIRLDKEKSALKMAEHEFFK